MKLVDLERAVCEHSGEFLCRRTHEEQFRKTIPFAHAVTPSTGSQDVPDLGRLKDFYDTFGSVTFYHDEESGDAALHIAPVSEWATLHDYFSGWPDSLHESEREECLPDWIDNCLVIGEIPRSGNYILVPTVGSEAGHIFEFEHDGFEFIEQAGDIVAFVNKYLQPDNSGLAGIASHLRFIGTDPYVQWWILEMKDNRGHFATTEP